MKILQLLNEFSMYNLGFVSNKIFEEVLKPAILKLKAGKITKLQNIDISNYLSPIIKQYTDGNFKITLFFRQSEVPQMHWFISPEPADTKKNKRKGTRIILNYSEKLLAQDNIKAIKNYIVGILNHELTHFVDSIRRKSTTDIDSPTDKYYSYFKTPEESNAFIHEIKHYISKDKKYWNNLKTYEDIEDALVKFIPTLENLEKENPQGFANIIKRFIKRLARENLLPRNFLPKSS